MEGILVKAREQLELDIIYKVYSGELTRREARMLLNVSESTVKRYITDFRLNGLGFVRHGNLEKTPKNKISDDLRKLVQGLMVEKYFDFNMEHAREKIKEETGAEIKRETFRRWCHQVGMVKRAKKRRSHPRYRRERMSQAGLMVLMDGSFHRWFGGIESCLIVCLDDATSEILWAEFFWGETTWACMKALAQVVRLKGIFKVLYTDKAGVYGGIKREGFAQVKRALGELGTTVIYANSPEAKGRIERLFQTLQDRLIPEMRIKGIKNMRDANKYLQEEYVPSIHNPKFSVMPENPVSSFLKVNSSVNIDDIFCIKEYRIVGRDHTISLDADRYMIAQPMKYSIYRHRLEIRRGETGDWTAYFAGKALKLIKIKTAKKLSA